MVSDYVPHDLPLAMDPAVLHPDGDLINHHQCNDNNNIIITDHFQVQPRQRQAESTHRQSLYSLLDTRLHAEDRPYVSLALSSSINADPDKSWNTDSLARGGCEPECTVRVSQIDRY